MNIETLSPQDRGKQAAGVAAVDRHVQPGMKLGLGTGSTAKWAILRTAERFRAGELAGLLVVPSSFDTEILCQKEGLPVRTLQDPQIGAELDVVIDGADELTSTLDCIKGGGGAHLQEKILCDSGREFILVADESKIVEHLGTRFPIPLEVHPLARVSVIKTLAKRGIQAQLRYGTGKAGPVVTDNGNFILDIRFSSPIEASQQEKELKMITGVLEVGLFPQRARRAYIGRPDGSFLVWER
ncbi:MAG: ribose 5-phosphate isomerase A [Spirochaetales bacterium]|nr:ribose 5-phosphate isomerase A [Spirochaetales bacterium]